MYLLAGILDNLPDDDVKEILVNIAHAMSPASYILIATSVLSEADDESLAVQRETRCRDLTMRQLQNTGARTLSEWAELIESLAQGLDLYTSNRLPGSIVTTMIVELI